MIGPRVFKVSRKKISEKLSTDGYFIILIGYAQFSNRDSEKCLRSVVSLDEVDNQLLLIQCNSKVFTDEIPLEL